MPGAFAEDFGGDERQFRVLMAELRLIQEDCGEGPATIAERLARCARVIRDSPNAPLLVLAAQGLGDWRVDDVRAPILRALVGGGMAPNDAAKLVRRYIDDRGFKGLVENVELALACIVIGFEGGEDEPGEPLAGAATTPAEN